ncbi:hypothetical protein [Trichococcus shcherbakoviae]|uniref:hypothetical protein n=1 Tax=Trichococcus shcherbakoviae TaxID=2094020 RepID=UPI001C5CFBAF|nr:hypothetical protein [Trichococcus shcherbakoviae]
MIFGEPNSGGALLAGGQRAVGCRSPAKPLWSEVMITIDAFLRRKDSCPELDSSNEKKQLTGEQHDAGRIFLL